MKMTARFLFLAATLFTVAGAFAVSCGKEAEEEEDIPGAGSKVAPWIEPPGIDTYDSIYITTDGTTLSNYSGGYSIFVTARELTFNSFTCLLDRGEKFGINNECNVTLKGGSAIHMFNGGFFGGRHVTLSGSGSITLKALNLNFTDYNNMFSAAEGYTLTTSGLVDEGNKRYSCKWSVRESN